jgi:hypothetical protein
MLNLKIRRKFLWPDVAENLRPFCMKINCVVVVVVAAAAAVVVAAVVSPSSILSFWLGEWQKEK